MTMRKGRLFDFEFFRRRHTGRLAVIVTQTDGPDVAYISPDGTIQWTGFEYMFTQEELDDIECVRQEIASQNMIA